MDLYQAIAAATATPHGTSEHRIACELCAVRGLDPTSFVGVRGMPPFTQWHRMIVEILLEQSLRNEMMS